MDTKSKHDWGLVLSGVLLVVLGIVFAFAPLSSLITLTIFVGAFFLVAGVFDLINYARFHKTGGASGWTIFYGILDIILGLMFLFQPVALAEVIPWLVGIFVLIFGIFEIIAAFRVRKAGISFWGWELFSGIIGVIVGICFLLVPISLMLYLAVFLLIRGISLIIYGWSAPSITWAR